MFRGSRDVHRREDVDFLNKSDMEWFELDFKSKKDDSHRYVICNFRINVSRLYMWKKEKTRLGIKIYIPWSVNSESPHMCATRE
jgi:hypothetical protein